MKMDAISTSVLDALPKATSKNILGKFVVIFPIGFFIVVTLFYIIAQLEFQRVTILKAKEDAGNIELLQFVIRHDLDALASDLHLLANKESFERYFKYRSEKNLASLTKRLKYFSRDKKIYSQVRYLNLKGHEVIRVDMEGLRPEVVPRDELLDKSKRYYFNETMEREWGQVFVSDMDLNVENGKVEKPLRPVMRIGSPVVDMYGEKKGIVLLNFDAEKILDRFSQLFPNRDASRFSFINKDGYWLRSGTPADEWGFMFGNKVTLRERNPGLWDRVKKEQIGQAYLQDGLYTYITIHAEEEIKRTANFSEDSLHKKKYSHEKEKLVWHLMLHVPKNELSFMFFLKNYSHLFWLVPVVFMGTVTITLHLSIIRAYRDMSDRTLRLLSTGLQQSPAAVVITNINGTIEYVNPKFMQMSGYDAEDVLGKNPRIFQSGSTTKNIYTDLWDAVLAGRAWSGTFENKRKDQSPYFVSATISPIVNKAGEITSFIAIQEDITEQKRLQEELEKLATVDGLTGAFNRGHFMNLFTHEMKRTIRYDQDLSILAFDLDFFKDVNDTYGHHGGDLVLQAFTEVVKKELRENDFLGRLGGEEFCVILVQTGKDGALLLAERLRFVVEEMRVPCDGRFIKVTVSIGVTEWSEGDLETEHILKRADRALYAAKEAGRNQVKILIKDELT
jgi:diguanylate cyclase (GGDEF)-like protein/PAS domain S-box-containing protein